MGSALNNISFFNKNFRFVYTPLLLDNVGLFDIEKKYTRFLVGAGALKKWIGVKNAETVLKCAQNSLKDKTTVKLRKCGKIEIYVK